MTCRATSWGCSRRNGAIALMLQLLEEPPCLMSRFASGDFIGNKISELGSIPMLLEPCDSLRDTLLFRAPLQAVIDPPGVVLKVVHECCSAQYADRINGLIAGF